MIFLGWQNFKAYSQGLIVDLREGLYKKRRIKLEWKKVFPLYQNSRAEGIITMKTEIERTWNVLL